MKSKMTPSRPGFTLIEMLVVIAIIIILAALTLGGFNFVQAKQAREKAKVQVGLLQMALEDFRADNGFYPPNPNQNGMNGTMEIYRFLYPPLAADGGVNPDVYLAELNPENDTQGWLDGQLGPGPHRIVDPWGFEFRYRTNAPGDNGAIFAANPGYDLWSVGPDGQTVAGPNGAYDPMAPENQDDIRSW